MRRRREYLGRFGFVVTTLVGIAVGTFLLGRGLAVPGTTDEPSEGVNPVGPDVAGVAPVTDPNPGSRSDAPSAIVVWLTPRYPASLPASGGTPLPPYLPLLRASSDHARGPPSSLRG